MRISDWSSDVCSSDLNHPWHGGGTHLQRRRSRRDLRDRRCRRQRLARRHHDHRSRRPCPGPAMTQIGGVPDMQDEDDYPYDNPVSRAQAESLREQARAGGLRFEAYLPPALADRSEEHTSELQSLMRISYAVFCLKKKKDRKSSKTEDNTLNTLQESLDTHQRYYPEDTSHHESTHGTTNTQ